MIIRNFMGTQLMGLSMMVLLAACGGSSSAPVTTPTPVVTNPPPVTPPAGVTTAAFGDASAASGLNFATGYNAAYEEMPRFFAGGVAAGDVDNDGDIDLFVVTGDLRPNGLYLNDGNAVFTDAAASAGLDYLKAPGENYKYSGPLLADFDGDGNLDLFIGALAGDPSILLRQNNDGTFTDITASSGMDAMDAYNTISAAAGDYDGDGDLDLILAHWGTPRDADAPGDTQNLWRNDSAGGTISFTSVSQSAAISGALELRLNGVLGEDHDYTFAPGFADIDNDGDLDLLMATDFMGSQVFSNNGDGTFADVTDRSQITDQNGMGAAIGDFDNDQDDDWFVSSVAPNRLYENMDGTMIANLEADIEAGSWGWGSCFADFDLDGDLDIYHTNGWIEEGRGSTADEFFTEDKSRLFVNNGDKTFTEAAGDVGIDDDLQGRGVVCADFNGDRKVDILLTLYESDPAALLWLNETPDTSALEVRVVGTGANPQGLGSIVTATRDGVTQRRVINLNSNYISHNPATAYFGFEGSADVEEIKVIWPDGTESSAGNVGANQRITFTHPGN